MNKYLFFIALLLYWSCKGDERKPDPGSVNQKVIDMIHIPDPESRDSSDVARMQFDQLIYDFDTVAVGSVVNRRYQFRNTGQVNLIIHSVRSTCGCTATQWPKGTIMPGDTSSILVTFDTKERLNYQNKPIFVLSNAIPNQVRLELNGFVTEKENN